MGQCHCPHKLIASIGRRKRTNFFGGLQLHIDLNIEETMGAKLKEVWQ
jgi:hypothetical protein